MLFGCSYAMKSIQQFADSPEATVAIRRLSSEFRRVPGPMLFWKFYQRVGHHRALPFAVALEHLRRRDPPGRYSSVARRARSRSASVAAASVDGSVRWI
jgi:hypothetical protein